MSLLEQVSIHNWIQTHQIKTESGEPIDFHIHRYLYDIYRDNSPFLCCIKAGQIGFSTMAIIKTIWLAKMKSLRVGYVLPTADMAQKFVGSKVNPMTAENKVIASYMSNKDAVEQKQVGKGFIHYVGAQTPNSAIMLTMDMLICDEYDKAPQQILEMFDSRLQHSKYKWKWVFSNPTIPNFGVDRYWEMSDKKIWHIKHSCGEIYPLDESCVDYVSESYRCPLCKELITDEQRRKGEWAATADGKWSGYWIPLWISPTITAETICEKKRTNTPEYFANFVAGTAYINVNNMLSRDILENCLDARVNEQDDRIIIGVDTGHNIHYTLANKQGMFYHGYCDSVEENEKGVRRPDYNPWNEIESLLKKYPRSIAIIDQGGDLIGPRILQAKYNGRVFLCWFTKEKRTQQIITWKDGEEYGKVEADRNRLIQLVVDEMKDNRVMFNGTKQDWAPWFAHALNIYRVKEIQGEDENDPQYGWRYVWKRKGPDHWFFSGLYAFIGLDRFGQDLAKIIHVNSPMKGVEKAWNVPDIETVDQGFIWGAEADI